MEGITVLGTWRRFAADELMVAKAMLKLLGKNQLRTIRKRNGGPRENRTPE